jgi:hypothetical protein
MATRRCVTTSTASTTFPNVPWPSSLTVRSEETVSGKPQRKGEQCRHTALVDYVVWHNNVVTLLVVA